MDSTLVIDVDRLPKEGLRVSRDFDFPSVDLIEENAVFLEPAHAEFLVRLIGEEIFVRGRITARLSFVCGRCLTPFEFPVASAFDLVYLPEELNELSDELSDEDLDKMYYSERRLDLRAVVLEQLNLTFPAKPLCDETCEGICAVCGEVVRDGKCSCQVEEKDPRWNAFKIFERDKS
jgi:uncharacterized protein